MSGIDVIATIDVSEIESVSDVAKTITGSTTTNVVPDSFLRRASQIELVDITPEALRRRLAHGNVFPAEEIDASLSNYFRVENLAALRQLSMLWVADRISESLESLLPSHSVDGRWETRERLVVGVSGSQHDDVMIRRAARLASRTGAELTAVHVVDISRNELKSVDLAGVRECVSRVGGDFQEIADTDIATALVAFTRQVRGTQIVLGSGGAASRTRASRGVVANVLRLAGDIDVHVVSSDSPPRVLLQRRRKTPVTNARRVTALVGSTLVLAALTFVLTRFSSGSVVSLAIPLYLAVVVVTSAWGGATIGVLAAGAATALENYYFIRPLHTLEIARTQDLITLAVFLAFSISASIVTTTFAQRSREAERARTEAEILTKAAAAVASSQDDLPTILTSLRAIFNLSSVELLEDTVHGWNLELSSGDDRSESAVVTEIPIDSTHLLRLRGPQLDAHDIAMVGAFLGRLSLGLRAQQSQREAEELRALADTDALRTGLLRSVSHDLRTPLATIEANVSSLLARDVTWSDNEQRNFLTSIEKEVHRLSRLVSNLLDASRLEAGVVTPRHLTVEMDDLIASALETIDTQGRTLDISLPDDLPSLQTDPDLYERIIANVVSNACRFSPPDQPVRLTAGSAGGVISLLVIDKGPGLDRTASTDHAIPKYRASDGDVGTGLGLSVATGFASLLGGALRFEDTPGGGLTVVIELKQKDAQ